MDDKKPRLRWKKHAKETGLRAMFAGPRGSDLHDGTTVYATVYTTVYALGVRWQGPVCGWYWASSAGGTVRNTCNEPAPDEASAKEQAMAFVKAALGAQMQEVKP